MCTTFKTKSKECHYLFETNKHFHVHYQSKLFSVDNNYKTLDKDVKVIENCCGSIGNYTDNYAKTIEILGHDKTPKQRIREKRMTQM